MPNEVVTAIISLVTAVLGWLLGNKHGKDKNNG